MRFSGRWWGQRRNIGESPVTSAALLPAAFDDVEDAPGKSSSYTVTPLSYASSIDAGLPAILSGCIINAGCAAAAGSAKLPVMLLIHGYQGSGVQMTDALRMRVADKGFVSLNPEMRGRGGSSGTPDDSARELQDLVDAVTAAAAANPTAVDTTRVYALGYSGGGANVVSLFSKYPGWLSAGVAMFGWGDYGLNVAPDHSYYGSGDGGVAQMLTRIGARANLWPYRARTAMLNLLDAVPQTNAQLSLLWDSADPIGRALADVRDLLDLEIPNNQRWAAAESTPADTVRWEHGFVETNPWLRYAENLMYRLRNAPAPSSPTFAGEYLVTGHLVHQAGFEVWTADSGTANPRTNAAGGRGHVVKLSFNARSRQYLVSPVDGPCAVLVRQAGSEVVKDITAAETIFDLSNLV